MKRFVKGGVTKRRSREGVDEREKERERRSRSSCFRPGEQQCPQTNEHPASIVRFIGTAQPLSPLLPTLVPLTPPYPSPILVSPCPSLYPVIESPRPRPRRPRPRPGSRPPSSSSSSSSSSNSQAGGSSINLMRANTD